MNKNFWMIILFIVTFIVLIFIGCCRPVDGGFFGPDPVVVGDTWTPMDKCWVYQPIECTASVCHEDMSGIKYFVTYVNQNGHHKIEIVDIDTWYNTHIDHVVSSSVDHFSYMYYQGGRA